MAKTLIMIAMSLVLASSGSAGAAAGKPAANPGKPDSAVKYCLQYDAPTGSRISKTECKTKAEWIELGVDVEALARKK